MSSKAGLYTDVTYGWPHSASQETSNIAYKGKDIIFSCDLFLKCGGSEGGEGKESYSELESSTNDFYKEKCYSFYASTF